jgi:hypothetical protein
MVNVLRKIASFFIAIFRWAFTGKSLSDEKIQKRIETCKSCERLAGDICSVCGCFVHLKAKMSTENCPLKKW